MSEKDVSPYDIDSERAKYRELKKQREAVTMLLDGEEVPMSVEIINALMSLDNIIEQKMIRIERTALLATGESLNKEGSECWT